MARERLLPPVSELEAWVNQGMTHDQIVEKIKREKHVDVTRSAVSVALSRAGRTTRTIEDKAVPWVIRPEHSNKIDLHLLRVHKRITEGEQVRDSDRRRYESWKAKLDAEDAVVHYEPRSAAGFWWVPRRPGIDNGLIREPDVE